MAYEGSGREKEAKEFISFFCRPEIHDRFNREGLFLSARKGSKITYPRMNEYFHVFQADLAETSEAAGTDWANPLSSVYASELKKAVSEVVAGITEPQDALGQRSSPDRNGDVTPFSSASPCGGKQRQVRRFSRGRIFGFNRLRPELMISSKRLSWQIIT